MSGILPIWLYWLRCSATRQALLAVLVVLFVGTATAEVGTQENVASLVPSVPTLFHLPNAGGLSLALDPAEDSYAEILIETSAPGIEFSVLDPDGRQLKAISGQYSEWLTVSFPRAARGTYHLVARAKPSEHYMDGVTFRAVFLHFRAGASTRTRAEALFLSAQTFARSPKALSLREAIDAYKQAGATWAVAGEREGQVLALVGEAEAWLGLSEYNKATVALHRAAAVDAPTSYWRAWLADLQAQVYLDRWENGPARRNAEQVLRLSHGLNDDWLTADALADRGESEYLTHDPAAPEDIAQALRLARLIGSVRTMARALRCSAWMEKDQGHLTSAFSLLDQAREYFHSDGDIRPELQAMATLAQIENTSGEIYSTLLRHSKLAPLMRETGYAAHYAILLDDIGHDYEGLNRVSDALVYYKEALAAYKTIHQVSGQAMALLYLCSAELKENRLNESLRDCRAATAIVEQFHDPWRMGDASWQLGKVQRAVGQTSLAVNSFRRATEFNQSAKNMIGEAVALVDWGDTLESLGEREEARKLFDKALSLSETTETRPFQLEVRYRVARSEFELGRDEDAKRDLKIAVNSIRSLRGAVGNADLQASYFAQLRKCHDLYVDVLMEEQRRDPQSRAAAQALEVGESGRALTLLDTLAARDGNPASGNQSIASQEMKELHLAVERAYDQRLKLMIEGDRTRELDANAAALTQAINTLERAEDERKSATRFTVPIGRTLSSAEIAAASQKYHSTLVEYSLAAGQSYVWVIEDGKIESHVLPSKDRIESAVKRWRTLATARVSRPGESLENHIRRIEAADMELPRVAADLSCMLLAPFLRSGMEHLTIVPDGELHLLSFAALPENGCQSSGEPLAANRQVVLTPSLSVLLATREATMRTTFRGEVALLADPVFDRNDSRVHRVHDMSNTSNLSTFAPALPRLIGTREEAMAIAALVGPERSALYLDFNANLQTLLNPSLGTYRILHLASHGILDENMPGFSGIVLSLVDQDGQPIFGYLKTDDIANLDLRSDLVVLSSCDSAAGVNLSGEGVSGLNHAFLSAGARRVVSALWSVDDETSRELMIDFYSGMLRDGLSPPEALRRSRVRIMRNPHTVAPFYWAAFTITSAIR